MFWITGGENRQRTVRGRNVAAGPPDPRDLLTAVTFTLKSPTCRRQSIILATKI